MVEKWGKITLNEENLENDRGYLDGVVDLFFFYLRQLNRQKNDSFHYFHPKKIFANTLQTLPNVESPAE